ncbi:DUF262 domain-containing protein [Campylobacter ureolyticus]|uniref:DUF262 and DUF1524 domain-containing protein n=1 Tax=Campylobacter ureolyticus TaxID=827 RepID=A0AAE7JPF0_9BACT|nr:DUF262 domain-containing protein [Campylobacter ureolyticus]MCR8684278.1 DUF262 domain-containing HNH endonuclease family protein [Campylobacter ureolyticus]QKF84311.1 DUF262 and DUF1524 domain-containing protein [Campylobacter ureolyticus]QQY35534.1 DUF262 domain-containing protein [Campylobacter ureolyticus]SUX23293.1 Uncharacterized conserved protein [Campylobacter ureolyticus]
MSELIKKYNLDNLAEKNFNFKIPFFQREYSWDEEDVENLINDALGDSLDENDVLNLDDESSYYIGNIVVKKQKDGTLMLIDGQQRLMTLYLLAKFTDSDLEFYKIGYLVDDEDNENLQNIDFKNPNFKMQSLNEICKFIYRQDSDKIQKMLKKVYFTMTTLDENMDEKHYFEAINLNKMQLRKSDILKALFLSKANEQEILAKIWEKCEDMEHYYDENLNNIDSIKQDSINNILASADSDEKENQKNSPDNNEVLEVKSIVDFEEFLAIVAKILNKEMPLDPKNLIKNFKQHIFDTNLNENFITKLEQYRKLFDKYVFKRDLEDLYLIDKKEVLNKPYLMIQLLFEVQSSNEWLVKYLKECKTLGDVNEHIGKLEEIDKERMQALIKDKNLEDLLDQGTGTPHYFFYKLDYLLWKKLGEEIENKSKSNFWEGVKNRQDIYNNFYIIRTGSVEHIQPQSKCNENGFDKNTIHNFGNLALISGGRNSSLGDLEVNEKKAKIDNWIKGKQSIQSLKMLLALEKYHEWNYEISFEHHRKEMIKLLKDSLN